ncbi:DUF6753 family protein [Desulfolutivibrio sp.]|uniref:DUF6753 family protein n=1 Tax=Desulfolutivibrio sp. TaxID=2773296 RepID=UPI002F96294F
MTFLDKLLQGLPEDVKNHVQRVVINYELDPNNPEILLAVLCGHIESITGKIPAKIAAQIDHSAKIAGDIAEKNIEQREREIQSRLVNFVVENSERVLSARIQTSRFRWFCVACVFTILLAGGCLYGGYEWGFGERDADYRVELERLPKTAAWVANAIKSEKEFELVKWSLSDDGKLGHRFSALNGGMSKFFDCYSKGSLEWEKNRKVCYPRDSKGSIYGWVVDIK